MALDETIFLTGFPGFIAGRLVKRLATEGARFLLLVQPAFMQRAREEVARIASEMNANADSFHLIEGDITQADLGLSPLELERVRQETTILFHLAAIYDLAVRRGVHLIFLHFNIVSEKFLRAQIIARAVQDISAGTIANRLPILRLHQLIESHFPSDSHANSTSVRTPAPVEPLGA